MGCAICGLVETFVDDVLAGRRPPVYGRVPDDVPADGPRGEHVVGPTFTLASGGSVTRTPGGATLSFAGHAPHLVVGRLDDLPSEQADLRHVGEMLAGVGSGSARAGGSEATVSVSAEGSGMKRAFGGSEARVVGRLDDAPSEQADVRNAGESRPGIGGTRGRIVGAGGLSAGHATVNGVGETVRRA